MPVIEGLANRGHEVVLMMPFCDDCGKHENISMVHVKEYDGKDYCDYLILINGQYLDNYSFR